MSATAVDIAYFDPRRIKDGAVILAIGRRGTGKSTLIADLLSYKRDIKRGVCVSATERANEFWAKHIPPCFIHYEYSDAVLEHLFEMQRKVKQLTGEVEPSFCVLDDVLYDRAFVKSKQARQLLMNGRHDKIFTIISAQYLMDLAPSLRAQVDYVFALRDPIRANREKLHMYFAGQFPTFASFDEVFQACTESNECMVLDQNCLSYKLSDAVSFYRATPNLEYRIGASEYWKYSERKSSGAGGGDDAACDEGTNNNNAGRMLVRTRYPKK
jgi:thymidylate kinase